MEFSTWDMRRMIAYALGYWSSVKKYKLWYQTKVYSNSLEVSITVEGRRAIDFDLIRNLDMLCLSRGYEIVELHFRHSSLRLIIVKSDSKEVNNYVPAI